MVSALVPGSKQSGFEPSGLLLKGPLRVFAPENLTELFYLHALSITRSSRSHTTFFSVYTALFLNKDLLKMALPAR